MSFFGRFILILARGLGFVGAVVDRLANLVNGLLLVLLSPDQLTGLVRNHYLDSYSDKFVPKVPADYNYLEPWEAEVLNRYKIHSGRMLVLGSGFGREAMAIARRGLEVIGVDINYVATRAAHQRAQSAGLSARFHQADFLRLPYASASLDFVLLSSGMYSAIPGSSRRQMWLADVGRLLKPDGLALLSFERDQFPYSRIKAFCVRLNALLVKLPGSNMSYQPGDDCRFGHFFHNFVTEDEIRKELLGAGATIQELDWAKGYAVVALPPRPH
jgi:SAM-dependent methyltransferase